MSRTNGGLIGVYNPTNEGVAKGVWSLRELAAAVKGAIWPIGNIANVDYLIVAGGGAGGYVRSGGGGSGGLLFGEAELIVGLTYSIVIGAGGVTSTNGENSTFNGLTAVGGGHGGTHFNGDAGASGGSGGGAAMNFASSSFSGGSGITGQGNAGGNSGPAVDSPRATGGGGGAGGAGSGGGVQPNGGIGIEWLDGNYYGGGGGGSRQGTDRAGPGAGTGGLGGGGNGGGPSAATGGAVNTGGGGGGTENVGGGVNTGGSGVVIIRTFFTASTTTGTPTVTTDGAYNIYTFTGSGSITF